MQKSGQQSPTYSDIWIQWATVVVRRLFSRSSIYFNPNSDIPKQSQFACRLAPVQVRTPTQGNPKRVLGIVAVLFLGYTTTDESMDVHGLTYTDQMCQTVVMDIVYHVLNVNHPRIPVLENSAPQPRFLEKHTWSSP